MFSKYFSMAFEALILNKVRSFLTTLGIIIGVFSVIVMISLGQSSQSFITDQVKGLGAGVLIITPGNPKNQGFGAAPGSTVKTLTIDDAKALENVPGVLYVSPNTFLMSLMTFGKNNAGATIIGTNQNIQQAGNLVLAKGRFFTEQESRTGTKVVVLGSKLAKELFKNTIEEPLNAKVKIDKQRYRVIGVLEEKGTSISGAVDDRAYMPTRTFQQTIRSGKDLVSILMKLKSDELIPVAQEKAHSILRYRHAIREDEEVDFKIQTQAELLDTVKVVTNVFTFLLAGIAAISLIVGGIGIMNIMLVSVTERTREIGVRKAVGAKRRDILLQFLIESATISLIGGTLGMSFGFIVTKTITQFAKLPFIISPVAVFGAFAFSAVVGIFFGLYPANKASKLDPVDALRYE